MNIIEIPRAVLRVQYRLARLPLQLLEQRVVARMDAESPARLMYERSLGTLDAVAGNVLGDGELRSSGVALAQRSATRGRAAQLDAEAQAKQEHADTRLQSVREDIAEDRSDAHAARAAAVEDAQDEARRRQSQATATARKRTAAAKQNAEEVAARQKETLESAQAAELDRIRTAEKQASASAQSKLADADDKRAAAEGQRAQADRIEELADAEKSKRQVERADNV